VFDGPLTALTAHLPRLAREARLGALIVVGAAAYFPALALGLWLTGAVPRAVLNRARRMLRLVP
jgi:hypothetical protein